ncbi:MAG: hypothetical protein U1U88_000847 [Lawsonella clevelandensis]
MPSPPVIVGTAAAIRILGGLRAPQLDLGARPPRHDGGLGTHRRGVNFANDYS